MAYAAAHDALCAARQGEGAGMFRKILIPVDGSSEARAAPIALGACAALVARWVSTKGML